MAENSLEQFRKLRGAEEEEERLAELALEGKNGRGRGMGNLEETPSPLSLILKGSWGKL